MARECDRFYSEHALLDVIKIGSEHADSRKSRGIRHSLSSMLTIMLIGFLLGQNTIRGICRFFSQEDRLLQLKSFLDLPHGIPSPSCYSRTLAIADPFPIVVSYADFIYQLVPHDPDMPQHLCADGKACNGAMNRALTGRSLYIINIFLAAYHLFSCQIRVGPKSQEGKVLEQEIHDILYQDPSLVTADAMATKKAIVDLICKAGSNAVLPVKKNNKLLMMCLLEFGVRFAQEKDTVDNYLDLNGFSDSDTPSGIIEDTRCAVYDEDNRNEPEPDSKKPLETHTFFDDLYTYPTVKESEKPSTKKENKQLLWVRVGDRWVAMSHVHGRLERREVELFSDPDMIDSLYRNKALEDWENIAAFGLVTRYRGLMKRDPETKQLYWDISITRTPYIQTKCPESAKELAWIIRNHWAIEEGHRCLDDLFDEDHSTVRRGNAPETCSLFRKIAYNMLSLLEAKNHDQSDTSIDHSRRLKETLEGVIRNGITGIKKLLTHRFRSPFLT